MLILILQLWLVASRWSLIAGRLPGRTDNEVKNYWNSHLRRKLLSMGINPDNHRINSVSSVLRPQSSVKSFHQQEDQHPLISSSALISDEADLNLSLAASNPFKEMNQNLIYTDAKEDTVVKSSTLLLFKWWSDAEVNRKLPTYVTCKDLYLMDFQKVLCYKDKITCANFSDLCILSNMIICHNNQYE